MAGVIDEIPERAMLVRTHQDVIEHRGSLFNAARKWWWDRSDKPLRAEYVLVDVDGIVQEVYKPDPATWHKEKDPGTDLLHFDTVRFVFGKQDDSDGGDYATSQLAPDAVRRKYKGKRLSDYYRYGNNRRNPVRYTF